MKIFEIIVEGFDDKKRFILANQGKKILAALANEQDKNLTTEKAVDSFGAMDPTKNKQFLQWIVNQYIRGQFKLEDGYKVTDALKLFVRFSKELEQKDINKYSYDSLVDAVEQFNVPAEAAENTDHGRARIFMKSPDGFMVIQPLDKEAACYYGRGTRWCTADQRHNAFDSYKDDLYILNLGDRKFQFHYRTGSFMNEQDRPVNKNEIALLSKSPGYTKFLNSQIEKHYKKLLDLV